MKPITICSACYSACRAIRSASGEVMEDSRLIREALELHDIHQRGFTVGMDYVALDLLDPRAKPRMKKRVRVELRGGKGTLK